jgi:hypothetical protein
MLQFSLTEVQMQRHTNRGGAVEQDKNRNYGFSKHCWTKVGYLSASSQSVGLFINFLTPGRKKGKRPTVNGERLNSV